MASILRRVPATISSSLPATPPGDTAASRAHLRVSSLETLSRGTSLDVFEDGERKRYVTALACTPEARLATEPATRSTKTQCGQMAGRETKNEDGGGNGDRKTGDAAAGKCRNDDDGGVEVEVEEKDEDDMGEGERNEVLFRHACEFGRDSVALMMIAKQEVQAAACHNDALYLPLHVACRYGRQAVVEALLHKGADPNARTATGKTPLHFAVVSLQADVVEALLKAGADSRIAESVQHLYAGQMATVDTPDNRRRWLADATLRQKTFAILDMLPLLQRELIPDFMRPHFTAQGGADYFELDATVPLDEYGCPYSDDDDDEKEHM
jgi:hypothetical protein